MESLRFLMATSFYPPYHLGGDAIHVRYLAEALAARGHEVHVEFSPAAFRLKHGGPAPAEEQSPDVHLHPIPSPLGRVQPAAAYLLGRSLRVSRFHDRLLRDVRPDVVHLHNISLLGLGLPGRASRGLTVYTAHDYWIRCPRSDLMKYGRQPCVTPTCVTCCLASGRPPQLWRYARRGRKPWGLDFAIAPSRFVAGAVATHLGCPVLCIPNFAPEPNPRGAVSDPGDYYLFVGSLEPHKGAHLLAAAACLDDLRVRFVGRGSLAGKLRSLRAAGHPRLELEGWISQPQLQPLYRSARALLLPSTCQENAPLAAIEALAWGTPLLVSRRGGLEEILHDGLAGRSFEPTVEGVRGALRRFEAEGLGNRLRAPSRSAYVRYHRPGAYLERYLAAVQDPPRTGVTQTGVTATIPPPPQPLADRSPGGGAL